MLCALALVGMVVFYMTPVQIPFYLSKLGVGSSTLVGGAIAVSTLAGATASMSYGRVQRRLGYRGIFAAIFLLMGIGYALVALASGAALVTGGLAVFGLGMGLLMPNLNNWAGELALPSARGAVLGGVTMCIFLGQFASPIVTQPLIDVVGLRGAFGVAAATAAAIGSAFAAWSVLRGDESAQKRCAEKSHERPAAA